MRTHGPTADIADTADTMATTSIPPLQADPSPRSREPSAPEPAAERPARRPSPVGAPLSPVSHVEPGPEHHGQRVDNFLLWRLKGMPRTRIYRMLRRGEVRVNGARVKPEHRLCDGDSLRLPPLWLPSATAVLPASESCLRVIAESIRYEDDGLIVLDKPAKLAVHGGSGLRSSVIDALRELRPEQRRLELVHRLDRGTSGCLMVAKKASTLRRLHALLREGRIAKRYTALCAGHWAERSDVSVALRKIHHEDGSHSVHADADGRRSHTRFTPLRHFAEATLVEAVPLTGRTHQIRVHAAAVGHPVLGDEKYGDERSARLSRALGLTRMFLHASTLRVPRETDEPLRVDCPLPGELQRVLGIICAAPTTPAESAARGEETALRQPDPSP